MSAVHGTRQGESIQAGMQFIREYQVPDPAVCDGLIACFEECRSRGLVHRGRLGRQKVNLDLKNSYDLTLANVPPEIQQSYAEVFKAYFGALGDFLDDYMGRFSHLRTHTRPCHINESPNIQLYPPGGGFFEAHFENGGPDVAHRVLTFQTFLNDTTEGGGTRFVYQDYTCQPAKGKTILWPAGFTHVHCGVVAPKDEKYIITGWWSYDREN
ncbi:MAG: 2OG-Fe(II) oxygenase [Gammaproteobacteria bacterium]|nr:2OG-Fe(II) oxygenase [Gammaproteobacteria bacterium]